MHESHLLGGFVVVKKEHGNVESVKEPNRKQVIRRHNVTVVWVSGLREIFVCNVCRIHGSYSPQLMRKKWAKKRKKTLTQYLKLIMISEDFPNDVEELTINLKLI